MSANTYGRQVVVPLTNKSGGGVIAGDVVIVDTTNNDAFTTTTSAATTNIVGVAQETIASNATGRVLIQGYAALVLTSGSVTRGNYGATHTVAKQAADAGSSRVAGAFCKFLTAGTTPDAIVWNPDLGGASLTNPMNAVGDIIQGTTAGAPARLGAGTAGQFHMANGAATATSWASRELDYVAFTSNVSITHTTEGTSDTIVTGSSITYDGSTAVMIEFYCPTLAVQQTAGAFVNILFYEDSTILGLVAQIRTPSATSPNLTPVFAALRRTPAAGAKVMTVKATTSSGTSTANAGTGGTGQNTAGYIRIIRAV